MPGSPPPRVFISYSQDSPSHMDRVRGLADRLRKDGIDAMIDQYETCLERWPCWCKDRIEQADFVLLVCTEIYHRRFCGKQETGKGLGVSWEAPIIQQLLYDSGSVSTKFIPVLFADGSTQHIPTEIRGFSYFEVDTPDGYDALYRQLTGQPWVQMPPLGKLRSLPLKDELAIRGAVPQAGDLATARTAGTTQHEDEDEVAGLVGPQPHLTVRRRLYHPLNGDVVPWFRYEQSVRGGFKAFLEERAQVFCGRQWVFEQINSWRDTRSEKCMLIVGEPGIGKSAIVAHLVEHNPENQVVAYHCCLGNDVLTLLPGRFVRSIAILLAERLEAYAEYIAQRELREMLSQDNCRESPENAFKVGVLNPLRDLAPPAASSGGACYILVDALDEAISSKRSESERTIIDVLQATLSMFPFWLRLLATTRPGTVVDRLAEADPWICNIGARDKRNQQDVSEYVLSKYVQTRLKNVSDNTARKLCKCSEENFLYLKCVVDAFPDHIADVNAIPKGVTGLYLADFRKYFGDPPSESYKITADVLAVVAVARQPLSLGHIAHAVEVSEAELNKVLAPLSAYLREEGGSYTFFHKSFADWLLDPSPRHFYHIRESEGHMALARVAADILHQLESDPDVLAGEACDSCHSYVLRHGVYHFVKAAQFACAIDLLCLLFQHRTGWEDITKSLLGGLRRFVLVELRHCKPEEARRIDPKHLADLLEGFYEIEPLAGAVDLLVRYQREAWSDLVGQLLNAENFVLRYAMSESLADACTAPCSLVKVTYLADLLNGNTINERELGGYALRFVYARKPELIDPSHLESLAESETYPGRSILGDLLLDLIFQGRFKRDSVKSERFWNPIWDFNKLDVWDLEAAESFMEGSPLPSSVVPEVTDALKIFLAVEERRKALLKRPNAEAIRGLLQNYFFLGRCTARIRKAQTALAQTPDLYHLMRLLFSHPLWTVAEAAASVLSSIVEKDHSRLWLIPFAPGIRDVVTGGADGCRTKDEQFARSACHVRLSTIAAGVPTPLP